MTNSRRFPWGFALFLLLVTVAGVTTSAKFIFGSESDGHVVYLVPNPAAWTGVDGMQDQRCQVNSEPAGSEGNQSIVLSCFGVPDTVTGRWQASTRYEGYTGHTSDHYFSGYEQGVEGRRINGVETVNRWYVYDFQSGKTVMAHDDIYGNLAVGVPLWGVEQISSQKQIWAQGGYTVGPANTPGFTGACRRVQYWGGLAVSCIEP